MDGLRYLTYAEPGRSPRAGVALGERVHDLQAVLATADLPPSMDPTSWMAVLEHWAAVEPALERGLRGDPGPGRPLGEVRLTAPLLYPGALYCAGANYSDHLLEMTGKAPEPAAGRDPYLFQKAPRATIIGPGEPIRLPPNSRQVDWEVEIALVIGSPARNVPIERAMDHVLGLTILNDVSARDLADRGGDTPPFRWDWLSTKSFVSAAPMGPWITPLGDIRDLGDLALRLWVNGELKQDSNSALLVHGFADLVAFLSRATALYPGDVIATGTPAGVGLPKGTFLQPGDHVVAEVAGIGRLENPVLAG